MQKFKRPCQLRYVEPAGTDGGAGSAFGAAATGTAGAGGAGGAPAQGASGTFPSGVAPEAMKPEEQAAYWKAKAEANGAAVAKYGLTPEDVQKLQADFDALSTAQLSEQDKAIKEAAKKATAEATAAAQAQLVDAVLLIECRDRQVDAAALLGLDRKSFIKGGNADPEAIRAWVAEHSTPKADQNLPFPNIGQGRHEKQQTAGRDIGRAEAEKRFGKKS